MDKLDKDNEKVEIDFNPGKYIIVGMAVILFGVVGFFIWAMTMEVAEGVVAMGQVVPKGRKVVVQHQYGGTIEKIYVEDGSSVKEGDSLIDLDDTAVKSSLLATRWEYLSLLANKARLEAERVMNKEVVYPEEVMKYKDEPEVQKILDVQTNLFNTRKKSIESQKEILDTQKQGLIKYLAEIEKFVEAKKNQIALLQSDIDNVTDLVKEGYYPRTKYNSMLQTLNEYISDMQEQLSNIERVKSSIAEIDFKMLNIEIEFKKEVESYLTDIENKVAQVKEKYDALTHQLESMKITAPASGVVLDMLYNSFGQVIRPGEPILSIVPVNTELILEAKVNLHDIDNVKIGQLSEVMFTSLSGSVTPSLFGKVEYVSADVLTDKHTGAPYYLVKISIDDNELKKLEGKKIIPGMVGQVVITGEKRTFLTYMLKPFINRLHLSFREE